MGQSRSSHTKVETAFTVADKKNIKKEPKLFYKKKHRRVYPIGWGYPKTTYKRQQ